MKILVNLSTSAESRERLTLAWSVPLGAGALAVLVYFSFSIARNGFNYRKYHRSLLELQAQEVQWSGKEKTLRQDLNRPQYQTAFRKAKYVNSLIGKKEFSLEDLMRKVVKLLPPAVRLDSFNYSPESGDSTVRFTVVGKTQESVETFLSDLEDSNDFQDLIVVNEGLAGKGVAEASATCTAQYVGDTER